MEIKKALMLLNMAKILLKHARFDDSHLGDSRDNLLPLIEKFEARHNIPRVVGASGTEQAKALQTQEGGTNAKKTKAESPCRLSFDRSAGEMDCLTCDAVWDIDSTRPPCQKNKEAP